MIYIYVHCLIFDTPLTTLGIRIVLRRGLNYNYIKFVENTLDLFSVEILFLLVNE